MANVVSPNNIYVNGSNVNECMWRLSRVMKKAGWTTVACSDATTKVAPATNNTDNWGNSADPLLDTYPAAFAGAGTISPWIVLRGPSTLKIPITTAPTGSPLKGEKITQGAAEGELIGYVFDSGTASGWMVVNPRVGTFTNASAITGSLSSASFTPNGTIVTYVREFMFARNGGVAADVTNHQIFYICADVSGESAQLYSSLAATAGATAAIPPGCSASAPNQFPALGIVVRGVSGTVNTTTSSSPFGGIATLTFGRYHVGCANAIGAANVSPDGSFYLAGTYPALSGGMAGFGFTRVDDGDPGDCDPYVILGTTSITIIASWVRTSCTGGNVSTNAAWGNASCYGSLSYVGYQARGCPVTARDVASVYQGCYYTNSTGNTMTFNYPAINKLLNHPSVSPPIVKENIMLWTVGNSTILRHYKGRCRWVIGSNIGSISDTFDNKKYICVGNNTVNSFQSILIGPWDGVSAPT